MARTTWKPIPFALVRHPQRAAEGNEMIQEQAAPMSTTNPSFPPPQREQQHMKFMQWMGSKGIWAVPPKYLEIGSILLHVLLHAQAELLKPLPLGLHSSAVGLGTTDQTEMT